MLADRLAGLAVVALGVAYWHAASALPRPLLQQAVGPEAFPRLIAGALVLLGALLIIGPLLRLRAAAPSAAPWPGEGAAEAAPDVRTIGLVVLGLAFYLIAYERLGFLLASILFMAIEVAAMEVDRRRWLRAAPVVVLLPLVVYVLFTRLLGVTLPAGLLG